MLKLEKKSICKFHSAVQLYEIVFYKKIYKFESPHFFIRWIFFLIYKNNIENPKFNFLTIICEIWKKRKSPKSFVLIGSTNFV